MKLMPLTLIPLFFLIGCSAKQESSALDFPQAALEGAFDAEGEIPARQRTVETAVDGPEITADPRTITAKTRKLVRSANISIDADGSLIDANGGLGEARKKLESLAARYNGYIEQSSMGGSSINCTLRIPETSFDDVLSEMGTLGKIVSRRENAEDVTIKYYDLEGRFNTKKVLLATFQSYLNRASSIEEIMQVESRIADLQNDIDWIGSRLTELSNLIDYATISVYVFNSRETNTYTFGDRFGDLLDSFGDFAETGLFVLIGIFIFGIPILVVVLLAYWLLFGRIGILRKVFKLVSNQKPASNRKLVSNQKKE
ncbi:MAG: DUF4349 domain-containing protein [Treponema sp.]|jgi:hypothetical protein|nr:DUF4349 domain-containing protein [Treponema sp.]